MISLGQIVKAFGIKGGVVIKLFNHESESLRPGIKLSLNKTGCDKLDLTIKEVKGGSRIIFDEIQDKDTALSLVGSEAFIAKEDLPLIPADEYYLEDILNSKIYSLKREFLGSLVGFSSNNAQNLMVIRTLDDKEAYVPMVEPFLQKIDFIQKEIIIDIPEDLLSL